MTPDYKWFLRHQWSHTGVCTSTILTRLLRLCWQYYGNMYAVITKRLFILWQSDPLVPRHCIHFLSHSSRGWNEGLMGSGPHPYLLFSEDTMFNFGVGVENKITKRLVSLKIWQFQILLSPNVTQTPCHNRQCWGREGEPSKAYTTVMLDRHIFKIILIFTSFCINFLTKFKHSYLN